MELKDIIIKLSDKAGPSGFEDGVRSLVSELISPYADEVSTDVMGNIIAVKRCGKSGAKKLMLDAHMDEIGFIVTGINEEGFLCFDNIGGVDPRMLPTREVMVLSETPVYGVIDTMPPHVLSAADMNKSVPADKLFIDVGLSREEAEKRIPLGTPAVFVSSCGMLGEKQLCGKALDDRACVAILIKTMEKLCDKKLGVDVYCLISTQEEVGFRGATAGVFSIAPDYAVAVDVTHAHTPDAKKEETLKSGGGAAIAVGPNMMRTMSNKLIELAKRKEIPYQVEAISGCSGTNGWAIQVSRQGVATAVLSLPLKYMHTPVETLMLSDAQAVVELLAEFAIETGEGI